MNLLYDYCIGGVLFFWYRYKDGVAISENSTCYETAGYSLTIKQVRQKDAGIFTIALSNQERGLYRNLSYRLDVRGNAESLQYDHLRVFFASSNTEPNSDVTTKHKTLIEIANGTKSNRCILVTYQLSWTDSIANFECVGEKSK